MLQALVIRLAVAVSSEDRHRGFRVSAVASTELQAIVLSRIGDSIDRRVDWGPESSYVVLSTESSLEGGAAGVVEMLVLTAAFITDVGCLPV